jgi:hypothetical protein
MTMSQALRVPAAPRISAEVEPISAGTVEHVLGTGDLSKLTTQQRVEYYKRVCQSLGINPLTRPFRFLTFQGQTVMYVTRDGTDQLRHLHHIDLTLSDKSFNDDLFMVTAQARAPDGRRDEDVGVVVVGNLKGEARANALMKATTKAKRRVTLSICGLGYMSEDELDGMPGARTFDAEDDTPPARPVPLVSAPAPPSSVESKPPPAPATNGNGMRPYESVVWLDNLRTKLATCDRDAVIKTAGLASVTEALEKAPERVQEVVKELLADAYARTEPYQDGDEDEIPTDEPEATPAEDRDAVLAAERIAEIEACRDPKAVDKIMSGMLVSALLARFDKARPELAQRILAAAEGKLAEMRVGGG